MDKKPENKVRLKMKNILIISCLLLLIGCYNRVEFTPYSSSIYTPRANSGQIEIFKASPATPFIELGYLQSEFNSRIRIPSGNILVLKKEAANVGAEAIINMSCTPDGIGWGPSFCQGTAIRFITR